MTEGTSNTASWLASGAGAPFAYLTTIGRRTGQLHRIEIWFSVHEGRVYLMSGGRDRADWVRNVRADGHVSFELGGERREGIARIIDPGTADDELARELLVGKYATSRDPLVDWKRRSLPVVIEFPAQPDATHDSSSSPSSSDR